MCGKRGGGGPGAEEDNAHKKASALSGYLFTSWREREWKEDSMELI